MPRGTHPDAPGALHHVMARGIERCRVLRSNKSRRDRLYRLAVIALATETARRPVRRSARMPRGHCCHGAARLLIVLLLLVQGLSGCRSPSPDSPSLVLVVIVDQLRADMAFRFVDRYADGGLTYLLNHGIHYERAYLPHAVTQTAPGHALIHTGAPAAKHGIGTNHWIDPTTGEFTFCLQDHGHSVLGEQTEGDDGTSPRNLTAETLGDALVQHTGRKGRVFAVSLKDGAAIASGGHYGKAFWYSSATGRFVTSTFYYDGYPAWVEDWNARHSSDRYRGRLWTLLYDPHTYLRAAQDDRPYEGDYWGMGRVFPHALDGEEPQDLYRAIRWTPMADALTVDFIKELIAREDIGHAKTIDMLTASLSATDHIGHMYGPNSLEAEDNMLRLDATITDLLTFVNAAVGLDRTLVVLTSDHGVDAIPEHHHSLSCLGKASADGWISRRPGSAFLKRDVGDGRWEMCCDAGRLYADDLKALANRALRRRFGISAEIVTEYVKPYVYFDRQAVADCGLDPLTVEQVVAELLSGVPGIAKAIPRSELVAGSVPDTPLMRRVQRSFNRDRSGDVFVVTAPHWSLHKTPNGYGAGHGTPHDYDTHVPLLFAGPGIGTQTVSRVVDTGSIACTVARYLGIRPPRDSVDAPLWEVLEKRRPVAPSR